MTTTLEIDSQPIAPFTHPLAKSGKKEDVLFGPVAPHSLEVFFRPERIALIGASEREHAPGRSLLDNLLSGPYKNRLELVNPARKTVLGMAAVQSIEQTTGVDLAIIVTPAPTVPDIVSECIAAGVKGAIVISAGFREHGEAGRALEKDIARRIGSSHFRIIGPNCLGVMNPVSGMNATFASKMALPGNVDFISQSGALCTSILDWSLSESLGFSAFVSSGSMLDVGWGDLIDYFGQDVHTKSIVIYMESIGDARSFLSAAREVALRKPIIVIKAGRTEAAAKAAASHTGAMTGSDAVLDAAFRRAGVLRVDSVSDLFHMAEVLSKQPRPKGKRLAIVTNAGGPGVLAADALMSGGGELAELSQKTIDELSSFLPNAWSHGNPIDTLADSSEAMYERAIEIALKDDDVDGLLAITAPLVAADPLLMAESISKFAHCGKPIMAAFMGASAIEAADDYMGAAGVPTFQFPDTAARLFNYMWKYNDNLKSLYETPVVASEDEPDRRVTEAIINRAREDERTILTEFESKQVLKAYGIPVVKTAVALSEHDAVVAADAIGYPVVLKLLSKTITHKSDIGGVLLNLHSAEDVASAFRSIKERVLARHRAADFEGVTVQPMIDRDGYELIVGSSIDPQFGPVLLFGSGGVFAEVMRDNTLALPPLNTTLARRMMEQTKIWNVLEGTRGKKAVDRAALERLMVAFSQLVIEQPAIAEIDINPLLASSEGLLALDARIVLHGDESLSIPKPAIRPYPMQYVGEWQMPDGSMLALRPIRPEDEPHVARFHTTLSDETVQQRYQAPLELRDRIAHERLTRSCFIDYDREIALVAERELSGEKEILGVARLRKTSLATRERQSSEALCTIIVSDTYQNMGLGTELLRRLLDIAEQEGITCIRTQTIIDNPQIVAIARKQGFQLEADNVLQWRS